MKDESSSSADSYESLGRSRGEKKRKEKGMTLLKAHGVRGVDSCRYCELSG